MRNFSLVILGLIFVVSCSEEDHRIDLSYTGEQLRFVDAPIGGIETGHMLINGDGSIRVFNIFGSSAIDSQQTSVTFFSLYAAEEGDKPVVRIMEREHFDGSAGIAGGIESSGTLGGSRGSKSPGDLEDSKGSMGSGGAEDSSGLSGSCGAEDSEDSEDSEGSEGLGSSGSSGGSGSYGGLGSSGGSEGTEGSVEAVQNFEAASGFNEAVFHNAFPLVQVDLLDDKVPLQVRMSAWSPFIPIDLLNSNLPVAVFEWELTNPGKKPVSYSLALTMQNPLGSGGQNGRFSLNEFIITPQSVSGWKGFTFSNDEGYSFIPGAGAVRVMSSSENAFYVPLIGDRQKALEQFWTDFSTDGKLESRSDLTGSSGKLESRGNKVRSSSGIRDDTDSSLDRTESWNDKSSSSGRTESWNDKSSSSGRAESVGDTASSSGRIESRSDTASSTGRLETLGNIVKYSNEDSGLAALYSTGVLYPGESVTIPFLFSWYVPFGHASERLPADAGEKEATYKKTGIPFDDKPSASCFEDMPLTSCSDDKPSAICIEDKASRSESKSSASCFKNIDEKITGYMVSGYENLRDKTMQFSHSMITSTISPEALDTVLSGFAAAVKQKGKNMEVISNPFPDRGTTEDSEDLVDDKSAWDNYYSSSGFAYGEKDRIMKFSPAIDVLPVRFFWATESGWGTINVSRARIVLDCIYGSLDLQQLLLEGRSFFVFREYVPSQNADISYDNETLIIKFSEELSITEGVSFTMEIP